MIRRLSRRYEVRVMRTSRSDRPHVWGYEEITVDGRTRTRHWNENTLPNSENWLASGLGDPFFPGLPAFADRLDEKDWQTRAYSRHIPVQDVSRLSGLSWQSHLTRAWQGMRDRLANMIQKVSCLIQKVPAAWRAAQKELMR